MQGPNYSLLPITMTASAEVVAGQFVRYDGAPCAAGDNAIGVCAIPGAAGESITVDIEGVITMKAGGVVTAGAQVESDAAGLPVDRTTGAIIGRALESAIAGERVHIRLLQN